jgi:hypothetical protein
MSLPLAAKQSFSTRSACLSLICLSSAQHFDLSFLLLRCKIGDDKFLLVVHGTQLFSGLKGL